MKVKRLMTILKTLPQDSEVRVASDEEWNTIYNDIELNKNGDNGEYVMFGLSGSEQPETTTTACMNCGSVQEMEDIEYLGEGKWSCPNCEIN